jgi:hypothetical protein
MKGAAAMKVLRTKVVSPNAGPTCFNFCPVFDDWGCPTRTK